eukprot:6549100-Pyramimonas_sp.AAC.1
MALFSGRPPVAGCTSVGGGLMRLTLYSSTLGWGSGSVAPAEALRPSSWPSLGRGVLADQR